LYVCDCQ